MSEALAEEVLFQLKGSHIVTGEWFPKKVFIYADRIEAHDVGFLKKTVEVLRYEQVAQVVLKHGLFFSELAIQSESGHIILTRGIAKKDAEKTKSLINQRIAGLKKQSDKPKPDDLADLIRKLADLKDRGVLDLEEFTSKKKELLSRI